MSTSARKSPHFFERERDGSARLRIRFSPEEATKIENAAGSTPLVPWIHQAVDREAARELERMESLQPRVKPD